MRVNIYGEELTERTEIVKKTVDQKLFYGVRFYLKSHPDLHHSESDNDESAVTFWIPWTKEKGNDFDLVQRILLDASDAVNLLSEAQKTGGV